MYPPSPYATPYGSFRTPVPPPVDDPTTAPLITVQLACAWLPYVRGALKQLLLESTWDVSSVAQLQLVQSRVFNLIDLFPECSSSTIPFACPYDYRTSDGGWVNVVDANTSPTTQGVYNPTTAWESTQFHVISDNDELTGLRIKKTFSPAVNVSTVVMQYNLAKGFFINTGYQNGILGYNGGALQFSQLIEASTDPDGLSKIITASPAGVVVDEIQLIIRCGFDHGSSNPGGAALITYAEIDGTGTHTC